MFPRIFTYDILFFQILSAIIFKVTGTVYCTEGTGTSTYLKFLIKTFITRHVGMTISDFQKCFFLSCRVRYSLAIYVTKSRERIKVWLIDSGKCYSKWTRNTKYCRYTSTVIHAKERYPTYRSRQRFSFYEIRNWWRFRRQNVTCHNFMYKYVPVPVLAPVLEKAVRYLLFLNYRYRYRPVHKMLPEALWAPPRWCRLAPRHYSWPQTLGCHHSQALQYRMDKHLYHIL
jgi:hypothetical protein